MSPKRNNGKKVMYLTEVYKLLNYSYMMQHKISEKKRLLQSVELQEKKIAVLCGATFGEIKELLEIFLLHYRIKPVFHIGEYNRFYEEAVFPNEELEKFKPDIILLHITNRNLLWNQNFNALEDKQRLSQIWEKLIERYHCTIVQNNFEYFKYRMIGNAARTHADGNIKYIDDMNQFITNFSTENSNFFINDINYLSSYIGLRNWNDERLWNMYKYPMAMTVMPCYALNIANIVKSILGKNKKTIITDLDNTLWGGEIGEIGENKIKIGNDTPQGEAFEAIHRYLKYLSVHGVALNICSKNEYSTGIRGINSAKCILKETDFVVKKINWNSKAENVQDILKELNLLGSSAVFIDDNPVECDSVKSMLPEVEAIQVTSITDFLEEMDMLSFFEITHETLEDKQRSQYYANNIARNAERNEYKNYDEYLKSLKMVCHVDAVNDRNIDRIVQLMNKTNQFNFLTKRYTLEKMNEYVYSKGIETFVLDLEDKFGGNGIVSVAIVRFENEAAYIDDWVMSCRVFERGLEFVMLKLICEACLLNCANELHGYYYRTKKNTKIECFFENMGFEEQAADKKDSTTKEWVCKDISSLMKRCERYSILIKRKNECGE